MITKMRRLNSMGTEVAFTLFAASELLAPYVHTNNVHAYVRESSITSLQGRLLQSGGRRAELAEADLFLLPTSDESIFGFARDRGEFKIAPMAVLLADLESHGGLAREQADRIMKEWLSSEK